MSDGLRRARRAACASASRASSAATPDGVAIAPGPREPDRRAHRLQRRLRAADGDRARGLVVAFRPRARTACCACTRSRCDETREAAIGAPAGAGERSRTGSTTWRASPGRSRAPAHPIAGVDLVMDGDVPIGAGLSSSAALEVAVGARPVRGLRHRLGGDPVARSSASAPRTSTSGSPAGSWTSSPRPPRADGRALLLDCRSLAGAAGAAAGARRGGGDGHRRPAVARGQRLQRAARVLRARRSSSLRAAGRRCARCATCRPSELAGRARGRLDERTWKRAAHVVAENVRPAGGRGRAAARATSRRRARS